MAELGKRSPCNGHAIRNFCSMIILQIDDSAQILLGPARRNDLYLGSTNKHRAARVARAVRQDLRLAE
eukprot:4155303-Pyramimonas_sp.AAC.1